MHKQTNAERKSRERDAANNAFHARGRFLYLTNEELAYLAEQFLNRFGHGWSISARKTFQHAVRKPVTLVTPVPASVVGAVRAPTRVHPLAFTAGTPAAIPAPVSVPPQTPAAVHRPPKKAKDEQLELL